MRWYSTVSEEANLDAAVDEVAAHVREAMQGHRIDLSVVFISLQYAPRFTELTRLLRQKIDGRVFLGASAGGVIGGGREVEQRCGLALTVAALPGVDVSGFALSGSELPDLDASPGAWRSAIGIAPEPLPQFIVMADPFSFPADQLLAGLDYAYPKSTKVGGLASGANEPGRNCLYLNDESFRSGAVGVALSGNIELETVVAQGCRPIGELLQVTKCQANILLELDGKSPLKVLQELAATLGEEDRELMTHSLFLGFVMDQLSLEHRAGDFLIRNLMGIDPERGVLAVGEHLREGQHVQFHLRDAQTSAEDLELVLARFSERLRVSQPQGALLFSCLGRGVYLYGEADHDTKVFQRHLGDIPIAGFFCNGEIGPVGGTTYLHGYTSSFGIFRPAAP